MLDEYNYWMTPINDERTLKAVWGSSDHRQEQVQQINELNNSTNLSLCNETSAWTSAIVSHAYLETMLVFLFAIILYFTLVFYYCEREREITKHEVDKSVVTRRVLPHGQSQEFNNPTSRDETARHCCSCTTCFFLRCCSKKQRNRKRTHPHPSAAETASEILEVYRTMAYTPNSSKPQTLCAHCGKTNNEERVDLPQVRNDDSDCNIDIALAEEGLGGVDSNHLTCPICFEPFLVEEKVTWSGIGNCRHVFHYDCVLPWAVLGHFECPVCRARFWSKSEPTRFCHPVGRLEAEMRQSRFCVQHGLVSS